MFFKNIIGAVKLIIVACPDIFILKQRASIKVFDNCYNFAAFGYNRADQNPENLLKLSMPEWRNW
jgi:hypothetical protein